MNVNPYTCKFCNKELASKGSLSNHVNKSKTCIERRTNNTIPIKEFKCNFCDKKFTTNQNFELHTKKCLVYLLNKIDDQKDEYELKLKDQKEEHELKFREQKDEYEKKIRELQDKLENIAIKASLKSTTTNVSNNTNNNNILNLAPLDMEILTKRITNAINNMTAEHVMEGQGGVAKLISSCFTNEDGKKVITCTDTSRGIWKSKDKDGNIIKDYKANKIAKVVHPLATTKANEIIVDDEEKRNKICALQRLRKRKEDRVKADIQDAETLREMRREDPMKIMYENRRNERSKTHYEEGFLEEQLNNELSDWDKFNANDEEKPFKLVTGKNDISELNKDSSNFSTSLISLVD